MPYMKQKDDKGKWEVFKKGEDGKPEGKTLGTHDSEEEADKQIAAIYANEKADKAEQPGELRKFAPMVKIEQRKDAPPIIWFRVASETPDSANEICDYEHSKPNMLKHSKYIEKLSKGKSKFNVREQHGGTAAGRAVEFLTRDKEKDFLAGVEIVDPVTNEKFEKGVLNGASIGGKYGPWSMKDGAYRRYEADPIEFSIVDIPSNGDAIPIDMPGEFEFVRVDGAKELRKFAVVPTQEPPAEPAPAEPAPVDPPAAATPAPVAFPPLAKASLQDKLEEIRNAWYAKFQTPVQKEIATGSAWITDVLDDAVIVQFNGELMKYAYSLGVDGVVTFGEPVKVERNYTVVSAEANKTIQPGELQKNETPPAPAAEAKGGQAAQEPAPADDGKAVVPPAEQIRAMILEILEELGLVVKEGDTMKAVQATDLKKSAEALDLVKADFVKQKDELSKLISDGDKALAGDIAQLIAANETLTKSVEKVTGMGPVVMVPGTTAPELAAQQEVEVLKKYQASATNPADVARFGELIAAAEIKTIQSKK